MALSGTKKGTVTQNSSHFEYYLSWSATQSIVDNESTITVKHYWKKTGSKVFDSTVKRRYGITIDGESFEGEKRMDYSPWADKNISTATHTVKHNDDGTKSLTISTYANGRAGEYGPSSSSDEDGDCTASVTITLDQIPRAAKLLSATNFTDEAGSTITYENPAGTYGDVQVCIADTEGSVQYAKYRSISQTGTSYTFNLTEEEQQALIAALPSGKKEMYVNIYIKTYIDGVLVENPRYLTRIFSVVNSTPELTYTIKDIGSGSTALTNDPNVIIKGFNYVTASMTPTFKKGATALNQIISNGNNTVLATTASFSNVENNLFTFYVRDSFGNEVTKPVTMTMVDYVKLTCNVTSGTPTADGNLAIKIHGNYFNNTFGAAGVQNTLTVKWRVKENNDAYGSWNVVTPTLTGNTYQATVNFTGLDYKTTYTIQAIAIDKISTGGVLSPERVTKSTPVFNWGEDNFDVNVTFDAAKLSTNVLSLIYPIGSIYMSVNDVSPEILFGGSWEPIQGRFLLGAGSNGVDVNVTLGQTGGEAKHALTVAELAQHNHGATSTYSGAAFFIRHGSSAGTDTVAAGSGCTITEGASDVTWSNGFSTASYSHKLDKVELKGTVSTTVNANGSGTPHNNMPPYLAVNIWKRTA